MERDELIDFVRARGLAVVRTVAADGAPESALVGLAATDEGELVFDTSRSSRKASNLSREPRVALVVGWDDEVTVQVEGRADVPVGPDHDRCLAAYVAQYPDGARRAEDPDICHVRVVPRWWRHSDFRPESFGSTETNVEPDQAR